MSFTVDGFDDLEKQLDNLSKKAEALDGTHDVPFSDLFTNAFMLSHSGFSTIDALLESSGIHIQNQADFENLPEKQLDSIIQEKTDFSSWEEMSIAAASEYARKKLGFN